MVLEVDSSGNQTGRNIYGTNLLMRSAGGSTYYYMYNGHADVTALINPSTGDVVATYYYDAFGNIDPNGTTGSPNNSITYAGYQYDSETGLYYCNARMYDPKIARFLQEDTYAGTVDDPLSLNLYTYCSNNPLIYFDPTGHLEAKISMQFYETNKITAVINGIPITYDPTYRDIKTNADGTNEFFGTTFAEFVYEESRKVNIKDPSYYYNTWDSPDEKVTFWSTLTSGNTWKEMAAEAFKPIRNFFVDIFTDEDRTDKSMFSYTPETKAKYDEEKIDRWISSGGSIDDDFLNESKKAFGEIKDYGVDKGTDEAAKYALGKGIEKAIGPIIGGIMKKSGDDVIETGIRSSDDIINGTGKTIKWTSGSVSNAAKQLENGATSVIVKNRSEAEELFLRLYQGSGYKNVTGMDAMDVKNLYGTKGNTYHWDDIFGSDGRVLGHSPTNIDGDMLHLQIHPEKGSIIRIFFEND